MTVTAPDVTMWWDAAAVTAAALGELRLTATDVDAARVAANVAPAGQLINQYLDRDPATPVPTPPPPELHSAIVRVTVNLYNRATPPNPMVDAVGYPTGSRDPLDGVRGIITRHRTRWGLG